MLGKCPSPADFSTGLYHLPQPQEVKIYLPCKCLSPANFSTGLYHVPQPQGMKIYLPCKCLSPADFLTRLYHLPQPQGMKPYLPCKCSSPGSKKSDHAICLKMKVQLYWNGPWYKSQPWEGKFRLPWMSVEESNSSQSLVSPLLYDQNRTAMSLSKKLL